MMWIRLLKVSICLWLSEVTIQKVSGRVEPLDQLPQDLQEWLDSFRATGDLTQQSARLVFWTSMNQYTCQFTKNKLILTPKQSEYLETALQDALSPIFQTAKAPLGRKKRTALAPRVRKEIRTMNFEERSKYYAAVNAMKNDKRLPPNVYDFLAAYHQGDNVQAAHYGPAFPSWHRLYLWIFEYFLRLYDQTVTIPYWASVLDNEMQDPTHSVIWSAEFFGNGDGPIRTGPFLTWPDINPKTSFTRNVQGNGDLLTYTGINRILSRRTNSEILMPTAFPDSNLELQHGAPHVFVGGTMNSLGTASRDPIFYSHHAFVDEIWERFRLNQKRNGINPQTDYPFNSSNPIHPHHPDANAGFAGLRGANPWTQSLGYLNSISDFVTYDEVPSCPLCANSPYLFCDKSMTTPRCVSRTILEMARASSIDATVAELAKQQQISESVQQLVRTVILPKDSSTDTCPRRTFLNDFDTRTLDSSETSPQSNEWLYIPVKIISKRPVEYGSFNKYSLYNQNTRGNGNYYPQNKPKPGDHSGFQDDLAKPGVQKTTETCARAQDASRKVCIVSYGLNYDGYSEECVILDNRLAVAEGIGFIPVKKPMGSYPSDVITAAFDVCGRVCRPYCKTGSFDHMTTDRVFTGALRVTPAQPLQFSYSFADATYKVWDVPYEKSYPRINYKNIPLTYYCEYTDTWIWNSTNHAMTGGFRSKTWFRQSSESFSRWKEFGTAVGQGPHPGNMSSFRTFSGPAPVRP